MTNPSEFGVLPQPDEPLDCTCFSDGPEVAECLLCGARDCPGGEPLHYHHDGCPHCTDGLRGPAREVSHGPFSLLDLDAEPVGGWWPDDVGEPVVRTEGPLHPRVGTVVCDWEDARTLPPDTLVECESVHVEMRLWRKLCVQWRSCRYARVRSTYGERIIDSRILYVPLERE